MRFTNRHAFASMLLAIAFSATALPLGAADVYRGSVNLPFETHWGDAVLQPGTYSFIVETGFSGQSAIKLTGADGPKRILPTTYDLRATSGGASLTIVNVDGTYTVKRLNAGMIGKSFDFPTPKHKSREEAESNVTVLGTH